MKLETIAVFRSPFASKFGVPRQSGLVADVPGRIVFEPLFRNVDAVRGLEGFDYLWMIWGFSANGGVDDGASRGFSPTVRPPVLGGNVRMGVWATRSPNRPNPIGLSSVRIAGIETNTDEGPVIHVLGADLMDGTPIYDIKPYVAYSDAHQDARSGFADEHKRERLEVVVCDEVTAAFAPSGVKVLTDVLACDPRPRYQDDPGRVYGMPFMGRDVRFRVRDGILEVLEVE